MRRTLTCNRVMCATVRVSPQLAAASLVYGVPNRPRFFTRKTHLPAPRKPFWAPSGRLGTEGSVVCDGTLPGSFSHLCAFGPCTLARTDTQPSACGEHSHATASCVLPYVSVHSLLLQVLCMVCRTDLGSSQEKPTRPPREGHSGPQVAV